MSVVGVMLAEISVLGRGCSSAFDKVPASPQVCIFLYGHLGCCRLRAARRAVKGGQYFGAGPKKEISSEDELK